MNFRLLLRSSLVGLAVLLLGMTVLFLFATRRASGLKAGIRIDTVGDAAPGSAAEPPIPGLPNISLLTGPRYRRYEIVDFPVADGGARTFRYLAYYLACARVMPDERRAEEVLFCLFPRPGTAEGAERLAFEGSEPTATITAGRAEGDRAFSSGEGAEVWVLTLSEGVVIRATEAGRDSVLEAEDLVCHAAERRVLSRGPVKIRSAEYTITGTGLSGDAGLGTFAVERDVTIELPTAALLGPEAETEPTTTVIRCGGPLLVQRLGSARGQGGRVPTRVTLEDGVDVVQGRGSAAGETSLAARRVELLLSVLTRPAEAAAGEETARIERLEAQGDVDFRRPGPTGARAASLVLERIPRGERIVFGGPAEFRHRGVLPSAGDPTGPGGEAGELVVGAGERIEIVRDEGRSAFRAAFVGDATAVRRDAADLPVLTLAARELHLASDPEIGDEFVATGDASFDTPGASGTAEVISWRSSRPGQSEIRLDGSPVVQARGGAGTNPFAPLPANAGAGAKATLHLASEGPVVLLEDGTARTFRLTGPATVRRLLGARETLRVRADSIEALLDGEALRSIEAAGNVVASGSDEALGAGRLSATADSFTFSESEGEAILVGRPAEIRIAETSTQANRIAAPHLRLSAATGQLFAGGGVRAEVFLKEEDSTYVRPVTLLCRELAVVPRPEEPGAPPPADPSGRIESLTATGEVSLDAGEWKARGELLQVGTGDRKSIHIEGAPARVEREQFFLDRTFTDRFTSSELTLSLREKRLMSFRAPSGGDLVMYRPFADDGPKILGAGSGPASGRTVERVTGHADGPMLFDQPKGFARLERAAKVVQEAGTPDRLVRIAAFAADLLEARFDHRPEDGALVLRRAEGRGNVRGEGEGWSAAADAFEVDFLHHLTIVRGQPAKVVVAGEERLVGRAVYDYERDQWTEFFMLGGR